MKNRQTGEVKTDADGNVVYEVGLAVADHDGRMELIKVSVAGEPPVRRGMPVTPVGLQAGVWEQVIGGQQRWDVWYRAATITPYTAPGYGAGAEGTV
ncbi:SCO3933 family regulatory protein [Sinosporangium siamense]|uniref:Uncharacterized protein n=1 Tax=Sinosporangium siamense TaxID=1367973 RepID=A0A919RJS3_9ACTN|nr:hypothetical protein [Sinosporangium siamense]GII94928.1 hypothetical protein Ssi02_51590 [Sinosporangium siamense]